MKKVMWTNWKGQWTHVLAAAVVVAVAPLGRTQSAVAPAANAKLAELGYVNDENDHAYLGVYVEGAAEGGGVKLGEIVPGSPAEKAGLKAGDVIVALNDHTIGNEEELRSAIAEIGVGQKAKVTFLREGEKRRTSARLAKSPGEDEAGEDEKAEKAEKGERAEKEKAEKAEKSAKSHVAAPVELTPAEPAQAAGSGGFLGVQLGAGEGGVAVSSVIGGTAAEKAGLQAGDVIVAVDGNNVESPESLTEAIRAHQPGDTIRLTVERDGERMKIKATLGKREGAMAGGGGVMTRPEPVEPPQPVEPKAERHAARAPAAADEAQGMRRQLEELRREVEELRRKCEQQQRTIDQIRRALNNESNRESTSMAAPLASPFGSASGMVLTGAAPAAGSGAPTMAIATGSAPATTCEAGGGACVAGEGTCSAGSTSCSGEACAAGGGTCSAGGRGSFTVVSGGGGAPMTVATSGGEGSSCGGCTITVNANGQQHTLALPQDGSGHHAYRVIVNDDGEAKLESVDASEQGLFFGTVQGEGHGQGNGKKAHKAQVQKLKLGGGQHAIVVEPQSDSDAKPRLQLFGQGDNVKVKNKLKVHGGQNVEVKTITPKMKSLGQGVYELRMQPQAGPRVLRFQQGMGGGMGGMKVQPMRARARVASPHAECNGACPLHCQSGHSVTSFGGGGALQLGPCTVVLGNGGCCQCGNGGGVSLAFSDGDEDDDEDECSSCDDDDDSGNCCSDDDEDEDDGDEDDSDINAPIVFQLDSDEDADDFGSIVFEATGDEDGSDACCDENEACCSDDEDACCEESNECCDEDGSDDGAVFEIELGDESAACQDDGDCCSDESSCSDDGDQAPREVEDEEINFY
jgi:type II secretory pathway component PulC